MTEPTVLAYGEAGITVEDNKNLVRRHPAAARRRVLDADRLSYGTEMKPALPTAWCFVLPEEALRTRNGRDIARMHVEDHDPMDRLQEAARRYRSTRTSPRVQAVILAKQGDTAPGIARAPGFSRRAVQ